MPRTIADYAEVVPDEYYELVTTTRYPNMTIFTAVEGINPPIAVPPSVKYVFPRYKLIYSEEHLQISENL